MGRVGRVKRGLLYVWVTSSVLTQIVGGCVGSDSPLVSKE